MIEERMQLVKQKTKKIDIVIFWNLPQTESMREEENKKMARHICTMATSLFEKEKLRLFLMIIFKHLNPSFVAIYYVIAGGMKIFWIRVSFLSDANLLTLLLEMDIKIYWY